MNAEFPRGKYIFLWGGLIMNAGGMTRAMLKRACMLLRNGIDVTILLSARGMEQLNGVKHYMENGYPEIGEARFVTREQWTGEHLSDPGRTHDVGVALQVLQMPFELKGNQKIYWKEGIVFASENVNPYPNGKEISYTLNGKSIREIYWMDSLNRIVVDEDNTVDGYKHRHECFYAKNGFCHTVFESIWKDSSWDTISIRTFDENSKRVQTYRNKSELDQCFFSSYVNECTDDEIFVFCDPILDFEPGFAKMKETADKRIYKIGINHGIGFGGNRTWNSQLNPRIVSNIEKTIVPNMDAFVLLTQEALKDFQKRLGNRNILFSVPNTIEIPERIIPFAERDLNRVIYIGRFDESTKQISHLIKAFEKVSKERPQAHLHIFGRGESEKLYRKLISDLHLEKSVILEPFTNNTYFEYQRAAFSVVCSAWEGFCLSLYESLANECPVISYDFRYGSGGIENEKNGIIVKLNDTNMLANKILWLLSEPSKIEAMSKNARNMIEKYSENHYQEYWAKVLNQVVKQHSYRTFLEEMHLDIRKEKYSELQREWTFSGNLTVIGSIPEAAKGMEHIYLRVYNSHQDDYQIVDVVVEDISYDPQLGASATILGRANVRKNQRISICLEWNNCFIESDIAK